MYKILFLVLFSVLYLFGQTSLKDEELEILAQKIDLNNGIVEANGDVVVYSKTFYITAKKLFYDKQKQKLELFGDVTVIKNNAFISFSQYLFIDIKKKVDTFKPLLVLDNKSKIWFNSTKGEKLDKIYKLKNSTLSSCDCKDPAWSIGFTSGDFDTQDQWINTYNTTLYIQKLPVFYTPYFGFPTDTTRRSGLLKPTIGYSKKEGFLYAQPIYYAPQKNYDIEYIPQNRAHRGYGQALKYRYVDSRYSKLLFETAIFKEKKEYQEEMNLENDTHYGWNLDYTRTKLFSKADHSDGFILKSLDMNDVDYINTKYDNKTENYTNKFLESEIKYYYSTYNYYGDIQVKLYNDISKDNNDDVMQTIPTINLHRYSSGILYDIFTTSLNISSTNKVRKEGIEAKTTQIYIPISYSKDFFSSYLNFTYDEQINYTNIKYNNGTQEYEDVDFLQNNHIFSLSTDLIKPYENYLHSIKLAVTYTKPNIAKQIGDIYGVTSNQSELSIFPVTKTTRNIAVSFNQSIYDKSSTKEIINHRINQLYVYNTDEDKYIKTDLQNDLSYFYPYGSLSNRLTYNYTLKTVISSASTLKFKKDDYFSEIYYTYTKDKTTLEIAKNIKYKLGFGFLKYYKLSYSDEYDMINNLSKKREYMLNIDKKCWAINFKLTDSLLATNTTDDTTLRQNILYVEFNLKQLFKLNQKYKFKEREE